MFHAGSGNAYNRATDLLYGESPARDLKPSTQLQIQLIQQPAEPLLGYTLFLSTFRL